MKIIRIITALILICILRSNAMSQENIESLFESTVNGYQMSTELDDIDFLAYFKVNFIRKNIADMEIPGFSIPLVRNIISMFKKTNGGDFAFISDSLTLNDEQKWILNNCFRENKRSTDFKLKVRYRTDEELNPVAGYVNNKFLGDKLNFLQKYAVSYQNFHVGFLSAKSMGEQSYLDFYSGYIKANIGNYEVLLGDFSIEAGMGNLLSQAMSTGKSAETVAPALKYGSGIKPNISALSNGFFRGVAVSGNFAFNDNSGLKSILWISNTPKNGLPDSTGSYIQSLGALNYFRTETEIMKKSTYFETSAGANIELNYFGLKAGIDAVGLRYSKPIVVESIRAFNGSEGLIGSIYSYYSFDDAIAGAEVSKDEQGKAGFQGAVEVSKERFEGAVNYKYFPSGFHSLYGYSSGEISTPSNQQSIYAGIKYKFNKSFMISAYSEIFENINAAGYLPFPQKGTDNLFAVQYYIYENILVKLSLGYKSILDYSYIDSPFIKQIYRKNKTYGRFDITGRFGSTLKARIRIDGCLAGYSAYFGPENGITGFAELFVNPYRFLQIGFRASYFSTDSYETALWNTEAVIPGYMTSYMFYGDGIKFMFYAGLKLNAGISMFLKWTYFEKYNTGYLGSGLTKIFNNNDKRLTIQLDYSY